MLQILSALIPIFSLIILGYFFKRIKFPSYEFWPLADKLTYFVLMPSLLIYKLSTASKDSEVSINYIISPLFTIFTIFILLILINKILKYDGKSFTSIMQGAIRFNTYIFLAISDVLFDDKGLLLAAILLPFVIIFINILCISTFTLFTSDNNLNYKYFIKSIISNPLIISCLIGSFIHFMDISLASFIIEIFAIMGKAALPMGLLSIGFGLVIRDMKSTKSAIILSSFAKLILFPAITIFFSNLFSLDKDMMTVLLIFSVVPTAPSSFVLARQLGGNIVLMSSIITIQTLISILIISFSLNYLGY